MPISTSTTQVLARDPESRFWLTGPFLIAHEAQVGTTAFLGSAGILDHGGPSAVRGLEARDPGCRRDRDARGTGLKIVLNQEPPLLAQVADVNLRPILPDLLSPGLDLVICGTAAGYRSAEVGAYYAHGSNKFWRILAEIGLTPRQLKPDEYPLLPKFGIGLTDLAKYYRGADSGLADGDLDITGFRNKIESICPHILAFNGKTAADWPWAVTRSTLVVRIFDSATRSCSFSPRHPAGLAAIGTPDRGVNAPIFSESFMIKGKHEFSHRCPVR